MTAFEGTISTPAVSGAVAKNQGIGAEIGLKTINTGENGATFIPSVSDEGVISWENDRELENPPPVNIKGPQGVGIKSVEVEKTSTEDGGTNIIKVTLTNDTVSRFPIKNGSKGPKGDSPVIEFSPMTDGYWISVDGEDVAFIHHGQDGEEGNGILSIKRTKGNGAAGTTDTYTVTYTNGLTDTFTVYNGKNGTNGKTPEKGKDYFTDADIKEMVAATVAALPKYNGEVESV